MAETAPKKTPLSTDGTCPTCKEAGFTPHGAVEDQGRMIEGRTCWNKTEAHEYRYVLGPA